MKKFLLLALGLIAGVALAIGACSGRPIRAGQNDLLQLAQARGLTPEDATRALKTFVPPGGRDEYMLFASGGHSGQVHVIGVPSRRTCPELGDSSRASVRNSVDLPHPLGPTTVVT